MAQSDMHHDEIRREVDGSKGRYVTATPFGEAELTYSILSPTMIIADHTGVPNASENKGVGRALVERMVEDARRDGVKIVPLCPFVNAMRRRNPDWADVFDT